MAGRGQIGRDPDSFYVDDCRQVQANTHSIQTLTGQITKLVGTLETDKDVQKCRSMVDDSVRQAKNTRTLLTRIQEHQHQATNHAERTNRRMMYNKLSDNLAITARVLEDVVRRFTAEERKRLDEFEEMQGVSKSSGGGGVFSAVDPADVAGGEESQPMMSKFQKQQDCFEQEMQRDKCQVLQRVDDDMRCLQRIYTDLANVADEQQHSFDSLESHIASASADIERGREEISFAKYSWDRRVKRKMMYIGAGAAVFIVGALAFWG